MSFKDFRIQEIIGKGSFASVYKVIRKSDNQIYALKRIKIDQMSKRALGDVLNEIRFLASVRHSNIVGFLEAFVENGEKELCIVMEYCGSGDLASKVDRYKKRKQCIDESVIWRYMGQVLRALNHLHIKGILHRDIKCANCFLSTDGSVKLGDLNVSKRLNHRGMLMTQIGTPYYMSPEIWNNRPYNGASDIWSLGCMIYGDGDCILLIYTFLTLYLELAALRPPFLGRDFSELRISITSGRYPPIPITYSDSLRRTISSMLKANPIERPTASALLHSPEIMSKLHIDASSNAVPNKDGALMETIVPPSNMKRLSTVLPKPCYPDVRPHSPASWPVVARRSSLPSLSSQVSPAVLLAEIIQGLPVIATNDTAVNGGETPPAAAMRPVAPVGPVGGIAPRPLRRPVRSRSMEAPTPARYIANRVIW